MTEDAHALVRLLQLASPALPIGAYSYSQGLEWAVEAGTVRDAAGAKTWIGDLLVHVQAEGEAAVLARLCAAGELGDWPAFARWNAWFRASRECAELLAETLQMGGSLAKLLADLNVLDEAAKTAFAANSPIVLPAAFALAARAFGVPADAAVAGYLWSWLENQVLAAIKLVPLGQVAGQKLLLALGGQVPAAAARARSLPDDDLTSFAPGLALASIRHETQYSRLFRS
ncbi:MAG: urease accessory protein UreF [Betaproteobacteria bacterium]|nr:urease accessory protein UreF [Betaproteobacteria bacterium]